AIRVDDRGPPARRSDLRLLDRDRAAGCAGGGDDLVDRVDLDVRPRLREPLAARREGASADLVGGLPHRVPLEAGDIGDLPAEQARVELRRPREVGDGDVDVSDVAVGHGRPLVDGTRTVSRLGTGRDNPLRGYASAARSSPSAGSTSLSAGSACTHT